MKTRLPTSSLRTLRYFAKARESDRLGYWLPPDRTPVKRLSDLVRGGHLQRGKAPDSDCFRITSAGQEALAETDFSRAIGIKC